MQKRLRQLEQVLKQNEFPTHDFVFELANEVSFTLEKEKTDYRPLDDEGLAGSLLDFSKSNVPIIVIPDIHARPEFILNILNYSLPEGFLPKVRKTYTVFEALHKGHINLVCVGDALHTEASTKERWELALKEVDNGLYTGPAMSLEMLAGINTICALMLLKKYYPENFHFLKGNHENIMNSSEGGDYAFRKYANEGYMVREFIHEFYGDDILYLLNCVEKSLPLVYQAAACVISHAEPKFVFTKSQIINARYYSDVVSGLTWTANDEAEEGSCKGIIQNLNEKANLEDYVYLAGHRAVTRNYNIRQNGLFIQIHNPKKQNICLVPKDRKFDPEIDIKNVSSEENNE